MERVPRRMTPAEFTRCLDTLALEAQQRIVDAERIASESRGALASIDVLRQALRKSEGPIRGQGVLDERDGIRASRTRSSARAILASLPSPKEPSHVA